MGRTIFHVDLDAFFVAVERSLDPSLNGRPVIVGGLGPRGVVSTASYEARKYGVHSAMPMAVARRLCPHAVYIRGSHERYRTVSRQFMAILRDYSPAVEPVSVDEAYIDMTGSERLYGPPEQSARLIKERVSADTGVTASIGIGPNRLIAKVASGESKPDGLLLITDDTATAFLAPLPVRKLPGIGPRAAEALGRLGIETLGQLAGTPAGPLRRALGPRQAESLLRRAAGVDNSPVEARTEAKSISAETTFDHDSSDRAHLSGIILELSQRVGAKLRKSGKHAASVTLKLRYSDFSTVTRQTTLHGGPVNGDTAISEAAMRLFEAALRQRHAPVRLIGVGVSGLTEEAGQLSMLNESAPNDTAVSMAMDTIRDRFGPASIRRGRQA
ncbi:MAG: DNA polymerase IV [Dehalococcoidia bacterium]